MKVTISFFQFIELLKRRFLVLHNDKYSRDLHSIEHKIVLAQHNIIYTFMIFGPDIFIYTKNQSGTHCIPATETFQGQAVAKISIVKLFPKKCVNLRD